MKYKVGDVLRIIAYPSSVFNTGDLVRIVRVDNGRYPYQGILISDDGSTVGTKDWSLAESEVEMANVHFEEDNKLKIGDLVKVIKRQSGHDFDIGETIRVIRICDKASFNAERLDGSATWGLVSEEVELINKGESMAESGVVGKIEDLDLPEDERLLRKYGLTNSCSKPTESGTELLMSILFKANRDKMVERTKALEAEESKIKKTDKK